ncbi:N-acetylmuramidase family protein [Undibacterium parvum]|uniref:N-acetylmuramidase family protein n=2 Tax=Undibacterium TaxID=401469 RepID=A0A6M4A838_9BURK|nr:N-acetylmuramidase family protein [Undibacterium parvum]AZP11801.1 N-acetylmuramidase family protein [Undibacterium parvum]QJQ06219.1 N-acetylmuramidase family protein [Undibacterium piscinae]
MSKLLEEHDFETAAYLLDCDVAAIKAVAEVESRGNGFLNEGKAKILFEGHIFYKYTKGAFKDSNPSICYTPWTKQYYLGGIKEYGRLAEAEALNKTAARMSASYGKFQVMGFNFATCGFTSVDDFYNAMQTDEKSQLDAFCEYIKHNHLSNALRQHDWVAFAKGYNGPEYWKNNYDKLMAAAYEKFSHEKTNVN